MEHATSTMDRISHVNWNARASIAEYGHLLAGLKPVQLVSRYSACDDVYILPTPSENVWRNDAACLGLPTEWFFPGSGERYSVEQAMDVCSSCSVRVECLVDALETETSTFISGIRGGVTPRARGRMLAEMRRLAS